MLNFRILVDQLEAITKRQALPMLYTPPVDPDNSTCLQLDRRLFNPKNW
jgi:hypothetical protein